MAVAFPDQDPVTPPSPNRAPLPSSGARLRSVDFLRGVAATAVAVGHAGAILLSLVAVHSRSMDLTMTVLAFAHFGVPLFFVVSGFCIHLPWLREFHRTGRASIDLRAFWKRRLRRLYPPYLAMLTLSMALVVFAPLARVDRVIGASVPDAFPRGVLLDFGAHLLMLHSLHPKLMFGGGNAVYWTLALEEYFYLLYFPLLVFHRRAGAGKTVGLLAALSLGFPLAMKWLLAPASPWWVVVGYSVPSLWIQWYLGMISVEAWLGHRKLPRWCSRLWAAPLWLLAAWVAETEWPILAPCLAGVACFTLVNALVWREGLGAGFTGPLARILVGIGRFSYSLYLVHLPVIVVCAAVVRSALARAGLWTWLALTLAVTAVCIAAGRLFFGLVERHFIASRE